jgi:TPR repeat protein
LHPRPAPLAAALMLASALTLAAPADNLQAPLASAIEALAEGDYQRAYTRFKRHAKGNALAQFNLGLLEQNGWGRPANAEAACGWFRQAAAGGIPTAQHFFGLCLAQGIGRAADVPAAIDWLKQAANGGHLLSLCTAGQWYIEGTGITQDIQQGLQLCAQAAGLGVPLAMLALGDHYRTGAAIPQNLGAARYWYTQAAEHRSPEGQYQLGLMLSEGRGGDPDPASALLWMEIAASEGYAPAYLPTAILYANADVQADTGMLAPEHLAKVYVWLMAAKARNGDAQLTAEIARIETMVMAVMPESWKPSLDQQVAEHLARYHD